MSHQNSQLVLMVKSALSDRPTYLKLSSDAVSVDRAIGMAVSSLRNGGKTVQANQLESLYERHQVFQNGTQIEKGTLLSELPKSTANVKGNNIEIIELDLIASHSGGL